MAHRRPQGVRKPDRLTIGTALTLAAAYAVPVGAVAVDIEGRSDLTLHLKASGTGNAQVKVYVQDDPAAAKPTAVTTLREVNISNSSGATVFTCNTGVRMAFPLHGVSGKWLLIAAQYSATDGALDEAYVTGNIAMT